MKYANPELLRQLGAEYALGTLRGSARRRFERLLRSHPEARAQVAFWELRLSEFGQNLAPVAPPLAARSELLRRTAPTSPVPAHVRSAVPAASGARRRVYSARRRGYGWAWPYAAGFATAATLVVAFLLGQRNPLPDRSAQPVLALNGAALPIYSARLQVPASSMQWLVSVSADHRQLTVLAADDFLQVGRHSVQLWGVAPGLAPLALGALPVERDASVSFDIPAALKGQPQVDFMISLEPASGASAGKPGALVLSEATALDAI